MKIYRRDLLVLILLIALVCAEYIFLLHLCLIIPESWKSKFVRTDCFRSEKGGKLSHTRRDCMQGQGMFCTKEQPCTPCPDGGISDSWEGSRDCRNCSVPFRKSFSCRQKESSAICDYGGDLADCQRCCTRWWNALRRHPAQPIIEPGGGSVVVGVTVSLSSPSKEASVYFTTDDTKPDPALSNGRWYDVPFVLDFAGAEAATVRAVTVYYGLYSNETRATYSLTNCSSAWLLDMSSVYTSGGMNNTRAGLEDDLWQTSGAATRGGHDQFIAARFVHRVRVSRVRVSLYTRDRWDALNLRPAKLQYRVAAGGRNSSEGWVTIANATDVPDVGVREYDISPPVTTQAMRLFMAEGYLATGTFSFNATPCV